MKGTITKIEQQKRRSNRFNIYIDGAYATSVHEDVLVRFRLSTGQVLHDHDWMSLLACEEENKAKQRAMNYVSYKPRTRAEVARHLKEKGFQSETISSVITWLQVYNYIDDRAYAKDWVEERRRMKGKGRYALRQEMELKGINNRWIMEALDTIDHEDERQLARTWAYKRYEQVKYLDWPRIERRLGPFLQRKGFPLEHITAVLRELRMQHGQDDGS